MRKRIRALLWGVAVVCLLLGAAWKFTPREPLLMEVATDVSPAGFSYCWLNNDELLRTRQDQTEGVLLRRNIRTGIETAPNALKKCRDAITVLQPSPDGKYMLWCDHGEGYGNHGFAVADGSHYFAHEDMNITLWMPDSRHWLEFNTYVDGFSAILHNIEATGEIRTLAVEPGGELNSRGLSLGFAPRLVMAGNRLLVHSNSIYNQSDNTIKIDEYVLGNTIKPSGSHTLKLPQGSTLAKGMIGVKVSPDGKQVALRLESQRVLSFAALLGRYLPFLKMEPQKRAELWVCDLDGRNLRLLGYVDENIPVAMAQRLSAVGITPEIVQELDWTPDGRKISFANLGRIYTVPIGTD